MSLQRSVNVIAVGIAAVTLLGLIVIAILSFPDLKRYLQIRHM